MDKKIVETRNPAPQGVFEVEGGLLLNLRPGEDRSFYRFAYRGRQVSKSGSKLTALSHFDPLANVPAGGSGDTNRLLFRYERNVATVGGGLFEALGVQPLRLSGLEKLGLRGTAQVGGDAFGDKLQFLAGLETKPYRIPGFKGSEWSNWLVVGFSGRRQEATDNDGQDGDSGLFTVRAFIGKDLVWKQGGLAKIGALQDAIAEGFLAEAPTYELGKSLYDKLRDIPAKERNKAQVLYVQNYATYIKDPNPEVDRKKWEESVRSFARGASEAFNQRPILSLYGELTGWAGVAGLERGQVRGLFTLTTDYRFLPKRSDVLFRLRYELGYERATPTVKRNQLLASFVAQF